MKKLFDEYPHLESDVIRNLDRECMDRGEMDDEGCYYIGNDFEFRPSETVEGTVRPCKCTFAWKAERGDDLYEAASISCLGIKRVDVTLFTRTRKRTGDR